MNDRPAHADGSAEPQPLRDVLARTEGALRRIIESNLVGVFFWRPDGAVTDANDAFLRIVRRSRDELRAGQLRWPDLESPAGPAAAQAQAEELRAQLEREGEFPATELSLRGPDGEPIPVLIAGALQAETQAGICMVLDRSELARRDAEQRALSERLALALELAPLTLYTIDRAGVIVAAEGGKAPERDPSLARGVGRSAFERWAAEPVARALVRRVLEGEEVRERVVIAERTLEVRGRPIRDAQGRLAGGVGGGLDLTGQARAEAERARLEERVAQLEKLEGLSVLAAGFAHDFNNLLTGILGNAAAATFELPRVHPAREALADVIDSARRASALTRQLLALASRSPRPEALDLSEQVRILLPALQPGPRARLALRLEGALPAVRGDADQLRQLVLALFAHARRGLGANDGTISLTTRLVEVPAGGRAGLEGGAQLPPGWYAQLEVSDDAAPVEGQWNPFDAEQSAAAGRGLGLSAVPGIVRSHGGGVSLRRVRGEGTTVEVLLPLAGPAPAQAQPALARSRGAGRAILIVDDEPQVRSATRRLLQPLGNELLEASDGAQAIAVLRACRGEVGAVLLDLSMPGQSGKETLRALREVNPAVRVILVSGYPREEALAQLGEGQVAFLGKPFSPEELVREVEGALAGLAAALPKD